MRREQTLIKIGYESKTQVKLRRLYAAVDKSVLSGSSSSVCGPVTTTELLTVRSEAAVDHLSFLWVVKPWSSQR